MRTERYKLIHFYGKGEIGNDEDINCNELFDLQNDPTELHNLYGKEGYEEITKELQTTLDNYRKKLKVDEF